MMENLFNELTYPADAEHFRNLLVGDGVRIERIVSSGQATPEGVWLEQDWEEWVVLLKGRAGLLLEGKAEATLEPGDYIAIPAGCRHRVTFTASDEPTVWLAVHSGETGQ